MFQYSEHRTDASLKNLLDRFRRSRRSIQVDFRKLVPSLGAPDRATHMLHPYPAKLIAHIPFYFLANSIFSRPGDLIADPFCGSGTVLLESQLSGRPSIGADCNPLARLLSTVKTRPLHLGDLDSSTERLLRRIPAKAKSSRPDIVNPTLWFHPHVIDQLHRILDAVNATRSLQFRDYFSICLSSCVRRVSLADPRLAVPVRLSETKYPASHPLRPQMVARQKALRTVDVFDVFRSALAVNRRRTATLASQLHNLPRAAVVSPDARSFAAQDSGTVQMIVTSPPYPGAQKYIRSSSLSLGWLGLCSTARLRQLKSLVIGREEIPRAATTVVTPTGLRTADRALEAIHLADPIRAAIVATYLSEMRVVLREAHRLLCPGGYLVLVSANNTVAGTAFYTQHYLRRIAEQEGLSLVLQLVDDIRSRGLMTKRNKTASVIASEYIHVLAKR